MTTYLALFGSAFATLLVIVEPFGNLPIFMSLTAHSTPEDRRKVALHGNVIALVVLLLFGFFGASLFALLDISTQALQISGGLLLFLVALQLLTGEEEDPGKKSGSINVAVVPLATPLIAGPGGIVAFMLQVSRANDSVLGLCVVTAALILVLTVSWITMRFGTKIMRVLGASGIMLLTKLSGMLLAAIATQLIITGVLGVVRNFMAG